MTTSRNGPYEVVRSQRFLEQWQNGLQTGHIPAGRQASLDRICSQVLARIPWIGAARPGQPDNYRTVLIPRITYRIPEIEIGYTIIEDDMTVRLEDVRLTSQQEPP